MRFEMNAGGTYQLHLAGAIFLGTHEEFLTLVECLRGEVRDGGEVRLPADLQVTRDGRDMKLTRRGEVDGYTVWFTPSCVRHFTKELMRMLERPLASAS